MKTLLLWLLLAPVSVFAQMQPAPPTNAQLERLYLQGVEAPRSFKKANIILLHTSDSSKVALRKVAGLLQQRGFAIDRLDYDLLSVSTKPKPFAGSSSHTMTILAIAGQGVVTMSGLWHGEFGSVSVDEPAAYTNPASKKAIAEIEEVGRAYVGGRLGYMFRP